MKRVFVESCLALVVIAGTWSAAHVASRPVPAVAVEPAKAPVDLTLAQTELKVHTGDKFWGLHLGGVVPCASMIVKGGGHLVMIAPAQDPEARCFFHVKDRKQLSMQGQTFVLQVIGPDEVHVKRGELTELASATP